MKTMLHYFELISFGRYFEELELYSDAANFELSWPLLENSFFPKAQLATSPLPLLLKLLHCLNKNLSIVPKQL